MLQHNLNATQRKICRYIFAILLLCALSIMWVVPTNAQQNNNLPEGATVSALGRTAQVRSDGSFTISNVPATIGRFRVRLIHPDGRTAQSTCLAPVLRGTTLVPPLVFGLLTPLSASLTVGASMSSFTAQGQTAQMQVTGNLQGGGMPNLTNDPCTTYLSSNTFYATVSPAGVVTINNMPLFPSNLTVTALNEGVVGTFTFQLSPNTDVDGDGMPNDWEVRNGFNPNNSADAAQDADNDGLTNLQEFQRGLAPRDADTDRDGISDGPNDPDGAGPIIAGPDPNPLQPETTPPTCAITAPLGGATVIEGETIIVRATGTDNVGVSRIAFTSSAGGLNFTDTSAPFEVPFVIPTGGTQVTLNATARDIAGNPGTCPPVTINVVPDPLTTVNGRVLGDNQMPLSGAMVSVLGRAGATGADGRFSIPNVPTVQGNLVVTASFTPPGGLTLTGTSAPTPPVRGGTTDVGDIVVLPVAFENNFGTLVLRTDDGFVTRALPFGFSFYGANRTQVFVNNNGHLTFNSGEGDFTETVAEFLSRQPRISAFWDDIEVNDADNISGLYVNDQLPGRFVVTWRRQLEYLQVPGPNTLQVILFSDGRIQYGYQGMAALDAITGLSPGGLTPGSPLARVVDFSATPLISINPGEAIYEQFEVPSPRGSTDPPGSGQNTNRNNPFDLDSGFILFTPRAGGGYDVRTIRPAPMPTTLGNGTVTGVVFGADSQPVPRVEVEIISSRAPGFRLVTNTDAQGRYSFSGVPSTGVVMVRATNEGRLIGQGAGTFEAPQTAITVNVHPQPASQKN